MATTADDLRLPRFSRTERALHWAHASAFLVLLGSGLCLYLPSLAELIGRRPLLKDIHVYTSLAWLAALALVLLAGDRRRLLAAAREIDNFDADDVAWLRGRRAPQGRFNGGQKVNATTTPAGTSNIAEWATVKDGKIAEMRVFFDARPVAEMFQQP